MGSKWVTFTLYVFISIYYTEYTQLPLHAHNSYCICLNFNYRILIVFTVKAVFIVQIILTIITVKINRNSKIPTKMGKNDDFNCYHII